MEQNLSCSICDSCDFEIPGATVNSLDELKLALHLIVSDPRIWIAMYRCSHCGRIWEERYSATGHGEVPTLRKLLIHFGYPTASKF